MGVSVVMRVTGHLARHSETPFSFGFSVPEKLVTFQLSEAVIGLLCRA